MSNDTPKPGSEPFIPPVSAFAGPIAELVGHHLLSPPTRPGLLASLASFEVLRVLGGGGMGVVVLARDIEAGRDIAIKLIRPELVSDQRIAHRFVKEAGHLQKLKHPNIVPVYEVSDRAEGPYFVMPYFERGSLAARIRPGQPMDADAVLDIALQVAAGLSFAHRAGIIHRDLKPANILLGEGGKSCLADFGLARTMFNDTILDVERQQLEGTAPYMSPGVAAGHAEDTRCDIYSFGALMYEMLTGEPPYAGRNTEDIRKQILDGPPVPIKTRNPTADSGLVRIAEGCMARELRDRYADMADVLADLERVKIGKDVAGPHDIVSSKKRPFSLWIPAGIVMIAAGLWLMWPSSPDKKPVTTSPPVASNSLPAPVISPIKSVPPPAIPQLPKPVLPRPVPVSWRLMLVAGKIGVRGNSDGVNSDARFASPSGICISEIGSALCVADTGNNTVREISFPYMTGQQGAGSANVRTLAGRPGQSGHNDGPNSKATFLAPLGIAVRGINEFYVAEFATDTIRDVSILNTTTIAGAAGAPGSANGIGTNARFRNPWSVAVDSSGVGYVVDKSNFIIRRIDPRSHLVTTIAGLAGISGYADGKGSVARFADPDAVAVDSAGLVYIADAGNDVVRVMSPSGVVLTYAGVPHRTGNVDGPTKQAEFSGLQGLAAGRVGELYVVDGNSIRIITAKTSSVSTLPSSLMHDGHGNTVHPTAIAADDHGGIYISDAVNSVIWAIFPPKP